MKKKLITPICALALTVSLITANVSPAFAAMPSEELMADETQTRKEELVDEQLSPEHAQAVREIEPMPETEPFNDTEVTPEISDETEENSQNPNGFRRKLEDFDGTDANPEFTPVPRAEGESSAVSGIQIKDDNLIYSMDDTLYNGYYMDSAGILYIVSNGIPELVNDILSEGTSYYKLPSNEKVILQKQTVFVNGQMYSGYFMDSSNIMYKVSNGVAEPFTGTLEKNTDYYNLSSKGNLALSQQTLYVKGKLHSGYYMDHNSRMYHVKKGSLTLVTGTLKEKTKYFDYTKNKTQRLSKATLYVKGKLYSGYYLNSRNRMYRAKKGSLTLVTGTLKIKTKYFDYKKNKTQRLSKATLYVKGKLYSGYYLNSRSRMYRAKKGSLTLVTGTLKIKTKYFDFKRDKTQKLSKATLYVKGKLYSGYYLNSRNTMYSVKKGSLTLVTKVLGTGEKYYNYKAGKTQTLSKDTLYVNGKIYSGYYLNPENRMHHVQKGICTPVNGILGAGTAYYNHNAKGMQTLAASTIYINGKVIEGMSPESFATLQRAQAVVASITNDSMSMETKLRICFDYVKTYQESRPRMPHYTGMDWPVIYANDMFVNGSGNCCSYAAAFAYMAKAIGYEEVYCCNSGGHGWAEIDGLIYDPEWSKWHHVYNYYALSYDTPTDQDYKGAIGARKPWMRIKL